MPLNFNFYCWFPLTVSVLVLIIPILLGMIILVSLVQCQNVYLVSHLLVEILLVLWIGLFNHLS